jgi:hypothetical protein
MKKVPRSSLKDFAWADFVHFLELVSQAMLATVGILVQQSGIHVPGEQFTNTDIFGAPSSVGFAANLQIFLLIAALELTTFYLHYGDGEPGDYGLDGGMLKNMSPAQIKYRKESEIVHARLGMIAFLGAMTHTLLFGKAIPF